MISKPTTVIVPPRSLSVQQLRIPYLPSHHRYGLGAAARHGQEGFECLPDQASNKARRHQISGERGQPCGSRKATEIQVGESQRETLKQSATGSQHSRSRGDRPLKLRADITVSIFSASERVRSYQLVRTCDPQQIRHIQSIGRDLQRLPLHGFSKRTAHGSPSFHRGRALLDRMV